MPLSRPKKCPICSRDLNAHRCPIHGVFNQPGIESGESGGSGVPSSSDHGALSGLSDDDHTQYLLGVGTHKLTVADAEPSSASEGDIWIDTSGL